MEETSKPHISTLLTPSMRHEGLNQDSASSIFIQKYKKQLPGCFILAEEVGQDQQNYFGLY